MSQYHFLMLISYMLHGDSGIFLEKYSVFLEDQGLHEDVLWGGGDVVYQKPHLKKIEGAFPPPNMGPFLFIMFIGPIYKEGVDLPC